MMRERGDARARSCRSRSRASSRPVSTLLAADEKALLQDAAVLGKVFWSGAVAALGGDVASVEARLHALERKEFVRRERRSSCGRARVRVPPRPGPRRRLRPDPARRARGPAPRARPNGSRRSAATAEDHARCSLTTTCSARVRAPRRSRLDALVVRRPPALREAGERARALERVRGRGALLRQRSTSAERRRVRLLLWPRPVDGARRRRRAAPRRSRGSLRSATRGGGRRRGAARRDLAGSAATPTRRSRASIAPSSSSATHRRRAAKARRPEQRRPLSVLAGGARGASASGARRSRSPTSSASTTCGRRRTSPSGRPRILTGDDGGVGTSRGGSRSPRPGLSRGAPAGYSNLGRCSSTSGAIRARSRCTRRARAGRARGSPGVLDVKYEPGRFRALHPVSSGRWDEVAGARGRALPQSRPAGPPIRGGRFAGRVGQFASPAATSPVPPLTPSLAPAAGRARSRGS